MCDIGDDPSNLPRFFGSLFPRDLVRDCREKLKKRADLRLYTTSIAMDDLEEVRAALGYREIDIVAASYGTIAAQAYMRQHPTSVRAVFLLGVATPGVKQPLLFAKAAQHAMDLLLEDCAADETCRAAFPDLRKEFAAVLARFKNGPVEAELLNPSNKHKESVQLSRDNFVERIRLLLYTTTFARFVPLIIHRAYENDFLPFETISVRYNPGALLARGMYMTITCSEGVPFITQAEMKLEAAGTFVGEGRTQSHMQACQEWPSGNAARAFINPVKSRLPVLMISGELDGSTPPWFARDAVKTLPNARQVGIRYYGHQLDSPCVWHILDQFIAKGSATELDLGCTGEIRRPPFATSIPQQMALQ
jgi:pimeloyl-ACP methyl ester carboxylesterase